MYSMHRLYQTSGSRYAYGVSRERYRGRGSGKGRTDNYQRNETNQIRNVWGINNYRKGKDGKWAESKTEEENGKGKIFHAVPPAVQFPLLDKQRIPSGLPFGAGPPLGRCSGEECLRFPAPSVVGSGSIHRLGLLRLRSSGRFGILHFSSVSLPPYSMVLFNYLQCVTRSFLWWTRFVLVLRGSPSSSTPFPGFISCQRRFPWEW